MRMLILLWFVFAAIAVLLLAIWYVARTPVGPTIENERQNVMRVEDLNSHTTLKSDLGGVLIYEFCFCLTGEFDILHAPPAWKGRCADKVYVFDDEFRLITFGYFMPDTATKIE